MTKHLTFSTYFMVNRGNKNNLLSQNVCFADA